MRVIYHSHSLSLSLSLSHTHTHTHTHSLSLSHTHTLSLSHTHTLSLSHTAGALTALFLFLRIPLWVNIDDSKLSGRIMYWGVGSFILLSSVVLWVGLNRASKIKEVRVCVCVCVCVCEREREREVVLWV